MKLLISLFIFSLIFQSCATMNASNVSHLEVGMSKQDVERILGGKEDSTSFRNGVYIRQYTLLKPWVGPQVYYLIYDTSDHLKEWYLNSEESYRKNQVQSQGLRDLANTFNQPSQEPKRTRCINNLGAIECTEY